MSDPTPPFTRVRKIWEPYDHAKVKHTLTMTRREFGINKERWYFRGDSTKLWDRYTVDFYFANPHDATIFALKYLE